MHESLLVQIMADWLVVPVVLIGTYVLVFKVPKNKRYSAYCRILMAGLTAFLIAKLLATLYQPTGERPFETMGITPGASYLDNPGFPSDHALFVIAITLAVWFETRMKKTSLLLLLLALGVCLGRVLALVHTPLDVIGGIVVACIGAVWYLNDRTKPAKRSAKA